MTYTLDAAGNRTNVTDSATGPKPYTPNNLNQYTIAAGTAVGNGAYHETASYAAVNYAYIGDTYLASVTSGANTYYLYYDALGRCVKRTLSVNSAPTTTYYLFEGEHWIEEYDSTGAFQTNALYGLGMDEILGRWNNNQPQWPLPDRNGNTSVVTTNGGAILEQYRYDAFGTPTFKNSGGTVIGSSAIKNTFLFTGREWNQLFSFYEYRARAYNPAIGRFMSEDPKGFVRHVGLGAASSDWSFSGHPDEGEYNLYRYCGNDPEDFTDPMGLDSGPFQDVDSAYRYLHATLNPLSVNQHLEFRTRVYENANGEFWTNKTAVGTSHNVPANKIPDNARLAGDHHTHDGYSYRNPNTGQETRANGPHPNIRGVADNQGSDRPSTTDKKLWQQEGKGNSGFSGAVSTPGGKLIKWDQQHSQPYSIPTAPVPVPKHQDPPPNQFIPRP